MSSSPTVDVTLVVGSVAEQMQVQANALMVETQTTSVGQIIQNQQILDLPLNGRQVTDLIVLTGASVQTATSNKRALQNEPAIAVAGGLSFGTTYLLKTSPAGQKGKVVGTAAAVSGSKEDPAAVERGGELFVERCGECHGNSAKGTDQGPNAALPSPLSTARMRQALRLPCKLIPASWRIAIEMFFKRGAGVNPHRRKDRAPIRELLCRIERTSRSRS